MTAPTPAALSPCVMVEGLILPESVEVVAVVPTGSSVNTSVRLMGAGLRRGQVSDPFDGDALCAIEAARLGLTDEYDPYLLLPTARVDPLAHQLGAIALRELGPPEGIFSMGGTGS